MNPLDVIANRFEIHTPIGQGGMGDVFRGLDRQTDQPVAIKLLKPDIVESDPDLIERFTREGEALRRLNHPNIVNMVATVEEEGLHYLIMQYVEGGSLRDLLDREPCLPVPRVLALGIELADALTRAHHLKIIHRDLKPENVLIDDDGTPLLTDFGVARMSTRTRMTQTGAVIGTYAYLSPEACMGEDLDVRTDIWSFGIMLYEMLTGHRPFHAEQSTAILLAILNNPLPGLAALRSDTPPELASLIAHMLEKDRDQRMGSARLVGATLEAIQQGSSTPLSAISGTPPVASSRFSTPTPSTPTDSRDLPDETPRTESDEDPIVIFSTPSQADAPAPATLPITPPPLRRRGVLAGAIVTLAVIAAILLAAALGVFSGDDTDPPAEPDIARVAPVGPGEYMVLVAQAEPVPGTGERDVTRFIVDDLTQRLEVEVPFSYIRIREYPQIIRTEQDAQAAAAANGASVVVWGTYASDDLELEVQIGVTDSFPLITIDRTSLDRSANVRVRLTNVRRQSIAMPVLNVLNVLMTANGDAFEVSRLLATGNIVRPVDGASPPQPGAAGTGDVEIVSGGVASHLHRGTTGFVDDTQRSVDAFTQAVNLDAGNPLPYIYRASGYLRMGDYDKALRDIETAQRLGPDTWASPLYMRGMYETSQGDFETTLATFDQIVALRPHDWFAVNYRGAVYYLLGDFEQARRDLEQAITLGPAANFPYILDMMLALRQGNLARVQADLDTVLREFPDPIMSTRMMDAFFGDQVSNIFEPLFNAAGKLILGQYDQVIPDTEAALVIDPALTDMYLAQGLTNCNLRDYPAAETAYTHAIEIEPDYVALYALRSEVRIRQGDVGGALDDQQVVTSSPLGDVFAPLIEAALAGEWDCTTFFNYDYSQLDNTP